jgi:hypothetical protein
MRVTSGRVNDPVLYPKPQRGVYELVASPSPHNNDSTTALPQLPEDQAGITMAVGNPLIYLVCKYGYYNAETDRAHHEEQQDANEQVAISKGKPFIRKPFLDKGPSRGTWTAIYMETEGKVVE